MKILYIILLGLSLYTEGKELLIKKTGATHFVRITPLTENNEDEFLFQLCPEGRNTAPCEERIYSREYINLIPPKAIKSLKRKLRREKGVAALVLIVPSILGIAFGIEMAFDKKVSTCKKSIVSTLAVGGGSMAFGGYLKLEGLIDEAIEFLQQSHLALLSFSQNRRRNRYQHR